MRFAYGTNGFANHRLDEALAVLADLGYDGVALTLDGGHLDPFDADLARRVDKVAARLGELGLGVVVETGGRYVLDPRRKHRPTLLDAPPEADRRIDLLLRAVRVAADLGAEAMSFWSGAADPGLPEETAWRRLTEGVARVVAEAERRDVRLGFEPEPGMFVDTIAGFEDLHARLGAPSALGITLDIGHCRCLEPEPVPDCVRRAAPRLVNVQIEDMRRGVHEHLEFGEGEIDFPPVLAALDACGYRGLVGVELPRHSHAAPAVAERSLRFLRAAADEAGITREANR
ncbi:sugar phosphate isomerase/epimerase family protein [Thermomonospora cellulosilytica]|uniref:Sugar phosphate isomerase/epimerase n=1 Tax=Thermomonospora cellulosilytica TaxID=1411118 RepID=A0A7W3MT81_9ACTN|nr:sugar phosphate isomerase/epimerase family protein [Thermomonospora cellulosilytica]MBA9001475.1 sugar phosphate isomerase/epimerase [Thermomonospora cellulosilytica]